MVLQGIDSERAISDTVCPERHRFRACSRLCLGCFGCSAFRTKRLPQDLRSTQRILCLPLGAKPSRQQGEPHSGQVGVSSEGREASFEPSSRHISIIPSSGHDRRLTLRQSNERSPFVLSVAKCEHNDTKFRIFVNLTGQASTTASLGAATASPFCNPDDKIEGHVMTCPHAHYLRGNANTLPFVEAATTTSSTSNPETLGDRTNDSPAFLPSYT